VRYENDLEDVDPYETALEFLVISCTRYSYNFDTSSWYVSGTGRFGTSADIRLFFALTGEANVTRVFTLMENLSLPIPPTMYRFYWYAKTLEDVMEEHSFTAEQIEWAGELVLGGLIDAMFSGETLPDFAGGYIPDAAGGAYFAWPLPSIPISNGTSSYGSRIHPVTGERSFHYGTDIGCATGTPVISVADGVVASAGENGGTAGTFVTINHDIDGYRWTTKYFHLSAIAVSVGDPVLRGTVIALSGATGRVTGPHLHIETICNGVYQNPLPLITGS
jgi:murein DD-endopeptidase MepM/ murein hydrolase activator NlpD